MQLNAANQLQVTNRALQVRRSSQPIGLRLSCHPRQRWNSGVKYSWPQNLLWSRTTPSEGGSSCQIRFRFQAANSINKNKARTEVSVRRTTFSTRGKLVPKGATGLR